MKKALGLAGKYVIMFRRVYFQEAERYISLEHGLENSLQTILNICF